MTHPLSPPRKMPDTERDATVARMVRDGSWNLDNMATWSHAEFLTNLTTTMRDQLTVNAEARLRCIAQLLSAPPAEGTREARKY